VPEALASWAAATPDAIALLAPGREPATYRELHGAVDRLAAALRARGLGQDDGVALLFPEGRDLALALLAAISVGIAVPLVWPSPEAEHRRLLERGHVRAVMVSSALPRSAFAFVERALPVMSFAAGPSGQIGDFHLDGPALGDSLPATLPEADDIALILRSSGTTGHPKLAPKTHRRIVSTCHTLIEARGLTPADRCLSPTRAVYTQGFNALAIPIYAGASVVSVPGLDLEALPAWAREYRPTYLSLTPAILRTLAADGVETRNALRRAPLRCINSSAGALAADEIAHLEASLGAPILNLYGMTEASAIAGEHYAAYPRVPGAVGIPWCDMRVVDERNASLASGQTGEIVVRGPRVFHGYLDDAEATAAAMLPGGWFRTGDLGYLDPAGYLHLTGRLSEVINRGGEKIVPGEVDEALLGHPAVAEVAVFGVGDGRLGEDVVAAVVLRPGATATPRELRAWARQRLAQFKVPRRIWMVERLPRTTTGKVQRRELARRWVEAHG
jgi:acyl-CoA synthetase (AMP-forming)/AMP-acid ligase II